MKHWLVLWLAISVAVVAMALLLERVWHVPLEGMLRRMLAEPGLPAGVAICAVLGLDILLPVPSSLVMVLSGVLFGVLGGGLLSLLGSLAGNLAGFELARRYGGGLARRLVGERELHKMDRLFVRHGFLVIVLTRPVPVLMESVSLVAGLSAMPRSGFVAASLLGSIPVCLVYAYAGAFALQARSVLPAVLVGVGVPALAWTTIRYVQGSRAVRPGSRVPRRPSP